MYTNCAGYPFASWFLDRLPTTTWDIGLNDLFPIFCEYESENSVRAAHEIFGFALLLEPLAAPTVVFPQLAHIDLEPGACPASPNPQI